MDWSGRLDESIRREFPVLDQVVNGNPLVYLDNAATTQKPECVVEAMSAYYRRDNANVHRGLHALSTRATEAFEGAREKVARFINACADEIVFTRGTTEAINLVTGSWGSEQIGPADTILLTEMEHHSNLVPWLMLAQRTGAKIDYVPIRDDDHRLDLSMLETCFAKQPKVFAFTHASNTLGVVNPVADLCRRARELGIITVIDSAQGAGHLPIDVQEIGCDFLAFSGHKMCGPTGIGVLFGRKDVLSAMPPWQGGGEMISKVRYGGVDFKPAPYRFEAGTPSIAEAVGLGVAIDFLCKIGRDNIQAHDRDLAEYAYERLAERDTIRLLGPATARSGLVTFGVDGIHAHDLTAFADSRGVAVRGGHHCNQPLMRKLGLPSSVRASFYLYNTRAEVDRFVTVIDEAISFFRRGL